MIRWLRPLALLLALVALILLVVSGPGVRFDLLVLHCLCDIIDLQLLGPKA